MSAIAIEGVSLQDLVDADEAKCKVTGCSQPAAAYVSMSCGHRGLACRAHEAVFRYVRDCALKTGETLVCNGCGKPIDPTTMIVRSV